MKKITTFQQVKTRGGVTYLVGKLSGVDVCLAPSGATDRDGNSLWHLIAKQPHHQIRGRHAELLTGGCVLVQLAKPAAPPRRQSRRRSASK